MAEADKCLLCKDAPCAKACPAQTRPDKFLRQLRFNNTIGAAETVLDNNPLGGICGVVCPVSRLCEGACVRGGMDEPVKIGAVQKYLHDYGVTAGIVAPPAAENTTHRVAIVGAGPGGLAAARELRRRGSQVTVYDTHPEAGGALRYALSPVRVNHRDVDEEVARIQDMGVEFRCSERVESVDHLFEGGFDDVFLAPGLQASRDIVIPGASGDGSSQAPMTSALSFLHGANTGTERSSQMCRGKVVVVVGGGSVAMDCAVTAFSLGASAVHVVTREAMGELPADVEEIALARQAGVVFHPEMRVQSAVPVSRGEKASDDVQGCVGASTIIVAAGQELDDPSRVLLEQNTDERNEKILIHTSEINLESAYSSVADNSATTTGKEAKNRPRATFYFAGGDAVTASGDTVVRAVADGKRAADLIAAYRGNLPAPPPRYDENDGALAISFCGVQYDNPFCLSSSPVTNTAEMIAEAYDAGWGGSWYKTLNREDKFVISHPSPRLGSVHSSHSSKLGVGIQNVEQISDRPLADNLKDIEWLRLHYPRHITGVSIMGYCEEDWVYLAAAAEGAGAHILELNFSCPQMARSDAGHHIGQQYGLIEKYTAAAKRAVSIPVIAKMTPNITDMLPAALAAQEGGADGISAINTLKSISHIDVASGIAEPNILGYSTISGFSGQAGRPIGLRFVAELCRDPRLTIPVSGMGGIYTWHDSVEYLLLGATNLQATTSVMQHGVRIVEDMKDGLRTYLRQQHATRLQDIVGAAIPSLVEPGALDATTEVVSVIDPVKCIGCGACELSCRGGAAQAISIVDLPGRSSRCAIVNEEKCVGCRLCDFVCPVGAISFKTRKRIARM
ncbi:unnamed protein product [Ectocarpus fasciculatus]